jgi:hypothetical protein
MGGDDFFRTRMGHRFFESTMPKIAEELERLNHNLEAIVIELREQRNDAQRPAPSEPQDAARGASK